jgi:ABC-type molybdate transport system substrate-binding protein
MADAIPIGRRALPLLALAGAIGTARADTVDLAVNCDTTLAPALRQAAAAYKARTGVRVFVFATGPGLILPQLVRGIQNDIVVTQTTILDQAVQAGVVASAVRAQWRNPLVIAGARGVTAIDRTFAAPDSSPASDIDGPALLARLGLTPSRILGAVDTDEVAFLLTTGAAQAGLLHMTDVRADERLAVIRPVPPATQPPLLYAASATRLARRPSPEGFVTFLAVPEGAAILAAAGLEMAT